GWGDKGGKVRRQGTWARVWPAALVLFALPPCFGLSGYPLLPPVAALCRVLPTLPANRVSHVGRRLPLLAGLCRALPHYLAKPVPGHAVLFRTSPSSTPTALAAPCRAMSS